jgi:hypothetical protein
MTPNLPMVATYMTQCSIHAAITQVQAVPQFHFNTFWVLEGWTGSHYTLNNFIRCPAFQPFNRCKPALFFGPVVEGKHFDFFVAD